MDKTGGDVEKKNIVIIPGTYDFKNVNYKFGVFLGLIPLLIPG